MAFFYRLSFAFFFVFCSLVSTAQVSFDSQEELEEAANTFFNEGAYSKAKPLFSQLLSKDALNANFNYQFGVCVMYTEADPLKPLPYIEGGANSAGVNAEAHYFLGKAYQYNYRFEDAQKAFKKAKDAGFSKDGIDLNRNIEECLNGKALYNPAIDFKPAQNKVVLETEFYRPYDFRKLKGKVIPMPPSFKTKYDQKNLIGTVVYTPSNSNVLVYASYGENGKNAKDLYKVNRLPNGEWALPQRLPDVINTKYDEDFAFFDQAQNTLLFASKGHNSMGGYDVFSSKYNADKDSWSTPTNLQFPVNSPFDDFLYVSDPNGKVAFFTTARNTVEGKLRVMKTLLLNEDQVELSVVEGTFTDKTDSLYNYAAITVLDPVTNQVVGKYRSNKKTGKYVLVLKPQNDYTMDVGPREANGFEFDLDVPKHDVSKSLQQDITYAASSETGTVTITKYFDATGKPDSLALAESKPLNEVVSKMVEVTGAEAVLASNNQRPSADLAKQAEEKAKAEKEEQERVAAEKAKQLEEEQKAAELAAQQLEEGRLLAEMREAEAKALAKLEEQKKVAEAKAKEEKLAKEQEDAKLLAEMKAAEEAILAEAKRKEEEKAATEMVAKAREAAVRDSIALVELTSLAKAKREEAKQDSILKASEELALAEKARLEEINREVELAKQKALKDSAEQQIAAVVTEAEKPLTDADTAQEIEKLSEEDLFLETIAKLEAQKAEQQKLIDAENAQLAEQKAAAIKPDVAIEITEEAEEQSAEVAVVDTSTGEAASELIDVEQEIAALKSDAEPQEYLDALDGIEQQIAEEAASRPDKDYDLKPLPSEPVAGDPVLQKQIDADRLALEQHQKIAQEKEKALQEELQSEKDGLNAEELALVEAIDAVEEGQLAEEKPSEVEKTGTKLSLGKEATKAVAEEKQVESEVSEELVALETAEEEVESTVTEELVEETDKPKVEAEVAAEETVTPVTTDEDLVAQAMAEMDALLAGSEPKEEEKSEPAIEEAVEEQEVAVKAEELEESEDLVSELDEEIEAVIPEVVEESTVEKTVEAEAVQEEIETAIAVSSEPVVEESEPSAPAKEAAVEVVEEIAETAPTPAPAERVETVGTIPFLKAEIRNPERSKPSFSAIQDKSKRRMIKRMRAEDVGRLAVLKNIRNEKIDAAGDAKAVESIQANLRNKDVLATSTLNGREEYIRPPFNKDDLKRRKDVFYKLEFRIAPENVSQIVLESMTPEQEMTFAIAEFDLTSDLYLTMADANSGYREYAGRGFDALKVVPYLNGAPTTLSVVEEIPFID